MKRLGGIAGALALPWFFFGGLAVITLAVAGAHLASEVVAGVWAAPLLATFIAWMLREAVQDIRRAWRGQ